MIIAASQGASVSFSHGIKEMKIINDTFLCLCVVPQVVMGPPLCCIGDHHVNPDVYHCYIHCTLPQQ